MKQKLSRKSQILTHLLFSNYFNVFAFSLFGPLYVVYILRLGVDALNITQLLGIYSLAFGVGLLFFGRLQNTIRRKSAIVVSGFFLLSVGAFGYLFIHSLIMAFMVQIWNALAAAWFSPAYKTLYSWSEDHGRETEEWSWVDGGNQILIALATFLGGYILTFAGFPILITLVGCLQLIGALYSLQLMKLERGS